MSIKMIHFPFLSFIRIQVKRLIKNNAVYEKRSTYRRCCWYVHAEVLSRFGQESLPVPCQWTYLTTGAREESREEPQAATGSQGNSPTTPQTSTTTSSSSNKRKSTGSMSITKFMKKCTDPEQVVKHTQTYCQSTMQTSLRLFTSLCTLMLCFFGIF